MKLVGKKTNRAAIGARIKVVTAGREAADRSTGTFPRAVVSAETLLQQTDRSGQSHSGWPCSKSTGRRAARPRSSATSPLNQAIEVTEFAESYRRVDRKPLPQPSE